MPDPQRFPTFFKDLSKTRTFTRPTDTQLCARITLLQRDQAAAPQAVFSDSGPEDSVLPITHRHKQREQVRERLHQNVRMGGREKKKQKKLLRIFVTEAPQGAPSADKQQSFRKRYAD